IGSHLALTAVMGATRRWTWPSICEQGIEIWTSRRWVPERIGGLGPAGSIHTADPAPKANSFPVEKVCSPWRVPVRDPDSGGSRIDDDGEVADRPLHQSLRPVQGARVEQQRIARPKVIELGGVAVGHLSAQHV